MEPVTALAIGSSVLSTGTSIFGALKGADAKKEMAQKQARLTFMQRMEEIRRLQREQAYVEGAATSAVYASNVQMSGSAKRYLNDLRSEHSRQATYARAAATSEKRLIEKGGKSPGLGAQIFGQAASGFASAVGAHHRLTS